LIDRFRFDLAGGKSSSGSSSSIKVVVNNDRRELTAAAASANRKSRLESGVGGQRKGNDDYVLRRF
jgi:hypothetical protein